MKNLTIIGAVLTIIAAISAIVFYPLLLIWALNTLFASLSIPYSFWTWLAILVLNLGMFGSIRYNLRRISKKL